MNVHTFNALHRRSLKWIGAPGMNSETAFFSRWKLECETVVDKERRSNRDSYHRHAGVRREDARRYRAYLKNNPEELAIHNEKRNARRRLRAAADPQYRFARQIRTRIWMAIHKAYGTKAAGTFDLLGCTRDQFLAHIQSTWKPGMTWRNYGVYGWHVDHIKPVASFDLTDPVQQRACFNYTNTQALWATHNLSKGATISLPAPEKIQERKRGRMGVERALAAVKRRAI